MPVSFLPHELRCPDSCVQNYSVHCNSSFSIISLCHCLTDDLEKTLSCLFHMPPGPPRLGHEVTSFQKKQPIRNPYPFPYHITGPVKKHLEPNWHFFAQCNLATFAQPFPNFKLLCSIDTFPRRRASSSTAWRRSA